MSIVQWALFIFVIFNRMYFCYHTNISRITEPNAEV